MYFKRITEPILAQNSYLIGCQDSGQAIIVDPMRDIDRYLDLAAADGMEIVAATETHIHADFVSGLRQFATNPAVTIYASDEGDADWKYDWLTNSNFNYQLLNDGHKIEIGNIAIVARHTPGHTPEHLIFEVIDKLRDESKPLGLVTGDFVFVGDVGRPDLLETASGQVGNMKKSASNLFKSLQNFKLYSPELMLWPGHGAGSACGKSLGAVPFSTVGYEQKSNSALLAADNEENFVGHILEGQPEPPSYFGRMKEINCSGPPLLNGLPIPRTVATEKIDDLLNDDGILFVDSREWSEFIDGHLPRSLFIPITSACSILIGSYIDSDKRLCLIADEDHIDYLIRHGVRVGIDNFDYKLSPYQLIEWAQRGNQLEKIDEIDMLTFSEQHEQPELFILDVRRSAELIEIGKIGQAHNIAHTQLSRYCNDLPKDRRICVYCRTGNRSTYASAYLASRGYDVIHIRGGIFEWLENNLPVQPA